MWAKNEYTSEAGKQLSGTDVKRDFKFHENILQNLVEESYIFLKILNVKASLQKKNSTISPINTQKLGEKLTIA